MTAKVKYSSAFSPVSKTSKTFNHPFSIKNLLNLDEKASSEGSEVVQDELAPMRNSVIRLSQAVQIPTQPELTLPLRYEQAAAAAIPAWIYATRYCRQGIPPGTFVNVRKPRKSLKKHKQRPLFSQKQIQRLEEEFANEKYISKSRRANLAAEINLTDAQVRTWFQNRRTRWRKEVHSEDEICLSDVRHPWQMSPSSKEENDHSYGSNTLIVRGYCSSL